MFWQDHQYIIKSNIRHQSSFPTLKDVLQQHAPDGESFMHFNVISVEAFILDLI